MGRQEADKHSEINNIGRDGVIRTEALPMQQRFELLFNVELELVFA